MASQRLRDDWLERIKAVWREYLVARAAVELFMTALERDATELPVNTKVRDAQAMSDNLEGTYLIRLFAAFESGLRSYYATIRDTEPPTKDLIDTISARRQIPDDLRDEVHEVREYRNALVHEDGEEIEPIPIDQVRSRICTFFARLPDTWKTP
jgi:hypothetical protein